MVCSGPIQLLMETIQLRNWLCRGRAQHRQDSVCLQTLLQGTMLAIPSALVPAPHNSIFPCMFLVLPKLLTLCWSQGECLQVSESLCGPFKEEVFLFLGFFCFTQIARIPTDFYSQILWKLFFPSTEILGWGSSVYGQDPSFLQAGLCSHTLSPCAQLPHMARGTGHFVSPLLLLISMWLFIYILRCTRRDLLDFKWSSKLIVLYFGVILT